MRSQELIDFWGEEQVELGWGFWYFESEGPAFWHGPLDGADWAFPLLAGLMSLAVVLCFLLRFRQAGKSLRPLHALRGLACLAVTAVSILAGDWDHTFLLLPIFAAMIWVPDAYFTFVNTAVDSELPQSDRGALGFLLSIHFLLFLFV